MSFFEEYMELMGSALKAVDTTLLENATKLIEGTRKTGGKVIIVGNGGSAAMASHVSVDLTKNAAVRAINFNEADLITCFANDFGYERWIEKALEFYADAHDVVILVSSSGRSPNIINGARKVKELSLPLITLSGFSSDNELREIGDINFWIDNTEYNIVEMVHHVWLLAVVDRIIASNDKNENQKGQ